MAGWLMMGNQKPKKTSGAFLQGEEDLAVGHIISQKSGASLLQNCDLPPPLKVFTAAAAGGGAKQTAATTAPVNNRGGWEADRSDEHAAARGSGAGGEQEKVVELLQALRRSQTRAREAEKVAVAMAKERDYLAKALLEESMQLFVHRQWVRLLELQISKMRREAHEDGDGGAAGGAKWIMALAFCLGVAGVGFAFGYRFFS